MTDEALRRAESAWCARPDDVEAEERYLLHCERGGADPPRAVQLPPEVTAVEGLFLRQEGQSGPVELRIPERRGGGLVVRVEAQEWARVGTCLSDLLPQLEHDSLHVLIDRAALPVGEPPRIGAASLDHLEVTYVGSAAEDAGLRQRTLEALQDLTLRSLRWVGEPGERMPTVRDRLQVESLAGFTPSWLALVRAACPELCALEVGSCPAPVLAGLKALPRLERLQLSTDVPLGTEEGELLGSLSRLRRLELFQVPILRYGFLAELAERVPLRELVLDVDGRAVPKALRELGLFSRLELLDLSVRAGLRDESTRGWERLGRLRRLLLRDSDPMRNFGLLFLAHLGELETLYLNFLWLGDDDVALMTRAGWPPKLRALILHHAFSVTAASVPHLRALLPRLETLWLMSTGIPYEDLSKLDAELAAKLAQRTAPRADA